MTITPTIAEVAEIAGKRGRKHDWRMTNIWGETMPRCSRCGLLGDAETYFTSNAVGWRAKPTYGCHAPAHLEQSR